MDFPKLTCFDVGARNGLSDLRQLAEHITLFSFEPGNIGSSDNRQEMYHQQRVIAKGLYHSNGNFPFFLMRNQSMSSMLKPNKMILEEYFDHIPDFKNWKKQLDIISETTIETTTIDDVFRSNDLGHIDYLKIDTQGTELDILKGAEPILGQKKILVIKTEFAFIELYEGQPTFSDIDRFLKSHGYKLVTCEFQYGHSSPFTNGEKPKWGIGGDAFYCIDENTVSDNDVLYRMAIVLGALGFQSNAAHLFRKLNLGENVINQFLRNHQNIIKKAFLKYFLPPIVINAFKKIR